MRECEEQILVWRITLDRWLRSLSARSKGCTNDCWLSEGLKSLENLFFLPLLLRHKRAAFGVGPHRSKSDRCGESVNHSVFVFLLGLCFRGTRWETGDVSYFQAISWMRWQLWVCLLKSQGRCQSKSDQATHKPTIPVLFVSTEPLIVAHLARNIPSCVLTLRFKGLLMTWDSKAGTVLLFIVRGARCRPRCCGDFF